jgi:hypothetical protein
MPGGRLAMESRVPIYARKTAASRPQRNLLGALLRTGYGQKTTTRKRYLHPAILSPPYAAAPAGAARGDAENAPLGYTWLFVNPTETRGY